ncbi:MAG: tail fiber domain-containing protein [Chloroflexota bacterium]
MNRKRWTAVFTLFILLVTFFSLFPSGRFSLETVFADQQISDDLIVIGSACIGSDCSNGEAFDFDTLRLKENNLRLYFQDTSNSSSVPTNDWAIVANDSTNGGNNYLAFEDTSAGYQPFTVQAGAGAAALFVESGGDVAIGNGDPEMKLHLTDADSPAVRLEQDNSLGWGEQAWDMVGNESNFFLRDATNNSKTPFRVLTDSNTDMLVVNGANVGIGTADPTSVLHVEGDAYINGTLTQTSDRNLKENIEAVDNAEILDQILDTPVYYWNYTADAQDRTHLGPMAQDLYTTTNLGTSTTIAPSDVNGALIASVQAIYAELEAKNGEIETLEAENAELLDRLEALELMVAELLAAQTAAEE